VLAVVVLLPFFWMVSVSLKPATEPFAIPARLWPEDPTLANYVTAFRPEFRTYFVNSMIVSFSTVAITVTLGAPCRLRLHAGDSSIVRTALMGLVVVAQMFPRAQSSSRSTR
jgi:multiple sugar transport system permease protein